MSTKRPVYWEDSRCSVDSSEMHYYLADSGVCMWCRESPLPDEKMLVLDALQARIDTYVELHSLPQALQDPETHPASAVARFYMGMVTEWIKELR